MTDSDTEHVRAALERLAGRGVIPAAGADVPSEPGLYAIHADPSAWIELGLGEPPDSRPLYVGKSEGSLLSRDLGSHFACGRTGQSTVRRSLAALLKDPLELRACPRDAARADRSANYGLEAPSDERLTGWMLARLRLAIWVPSSPCVLGDVETEVLRALVPPLNLSKVRTPWELELKALRATMADEARSWRSTQR